MTSTTTTTTDEVTASPDDVLYAQDAAAFLGIKRSTLHTLVTEKMLTPSRGGPSGRAYVFRRGDLEAFREERRKRMTIEEARIALGYRSQQGVKAMIANGQLKALSPVPHRRGITFDRVEIEALVEARARRLSSQQALERAGMTDLPSFQRWLLQTGGTVHWDGGCTAYEPDDVEAVRRAYRPEGGITLKQTASMLDVSEEQVRSLVHSGELAVLTKPRGRVGWRFDRPAVEHFKRERARAALRDVVDRWPRLEKDGVARSPEGGRVYSARLRSERGPTNAIPEAWQVW